MKRITTTGIGVVVALAMAACGGDVEQLEAEVPTLDVTAWTDTTELFMEYPPLVAGQGGALRGASHAPERFLGDDHGAAADRVHAGIGRAAGRVARRGSVAAWRCTGCSAPHRRQAAIAGS